MLNLNKLRLEHQSIKIDPKDYPHINWDDLKESGTINSIALNQGCENALPGNTLEYINTIIENAITDRGGIPIFKGYHGYQHGSCISPNSVAVHGVPNSYKLKAGDIVSIDVGTSYNGWYTDAARTVVVFGNYNFKHRIAFDTDMILSITISKIKAGISLLDIAQSLEQSAKERNIKLLPMLGGHYINKGILHQEPFISNVVPTDPDELNKLKNHILKDGDIICIEPVTCLNIPDGYIDGNDGWSFRLIDENDVAAHREATLLVRKNNCIVISA